MELFNGTKWFHLFNATSSKIKSIIMNQVKYFLFGLVGTLMLSFVLLGVHLWTWTNWLVFKSWSCQQLDFFSFVKFRFLPSTFHPIVMTTKICRNSKFMKKTINHQNDFLPQRRSRRFAKRSFHFFFNFQLQTWTILINKTIWFFILFSAKKKTGFYERNLSQNFYKNR